MNQHLFCVDGLKGGVEAIGAVYPHSPVQRCIVHQIRSSTRFVSYKDIKPLMTDLKKVYTAITEDEALENLMGFKEKWGKQYPSCVKSWEENWDILSTFFAYPTEIRKIIYTTNIIACFRVSACCVTHPFDRPIPTPPGFDGTFYPPGMETVPKRAAIVRANRYMVDHSDYLIAYAWHPASNYEIW